MMTDHYMFSNVCPWSMVMSQSTRKGSLCQSAVAILRTFYTSTLSASIYGSQSLLALFALQIAHLCSSPSRTSYYINHSCQLPSFKIQIDLGLLSAPVFAVHRIFFSKFLFHMAKDRSYKFSKLHDISKTTRGNFHASRWRLGDPPFGIFC